MKNQLLVLSVASSLEEAVLLQARRSPISLPNRTKFSSTIEQREGGEGRRGSKLERSGITDAQRLTAATFC